MNLLKKMWQIAVEDQETRHAPRKAVPLSEHEVLIAKIHQIASDGLGTSGETRALEQIHKLTTPLLVQRVK